MHYIFAFIKQQQAWVWSGLTWRRKEVTSSRCSRSLLCLNLYRVSAHTWLQYEWEMQNRNCICNSINLWRDRYAAGIIKSSHKDFYKPQSFFICNWNVCLNLLLSLFVPAKVSECVREGSDSLQHAVEFVGLFFEELYSLHLDPEHCSHAGLKGWKLSCKKKKKDALLLFCESSSVRKTPWHLNLFLHVGLWNVVKWEVFPWRCEMWVYSVQRCHYSTFIVTKCVTGQVLLYLIPTKLWSLSRWIYHNSLLQGHSWPTVSASCIALTCVGRSNNREYSTSCN